MLAKRNDAIEAARILLFISFTALAVTLTSCSQNEDNAAQVLPGSLAALSVGGSLLEGAVVTQIGPYNDVPRAVSILADGKILVAGASYDERLVDLFIARFDRGGRLDSAFGNQGIVTSPVGSGNDRVQAIAIQPDGRVLVAGARHNGQDLDTSISRYLLDGSLDTTFAQGGIYKVSMGIGNDIANALSLQEDGSILVAGTGHDDMGAIGFTVIKLMPQGIPDMGFGNSGRLVLRLGVGEAQTEDSALLVSVDAQNRVVLAGTVLNGMQKELGLVRLLANGSRDASFGNQGQMIIAVSTADDEPTALAIQPDSKLLVAVSVFANGKRGVALYRLSENGSFDDFGEQSRAAGGGLSTANQIRVLPDGKILLAGSFYHRDTRSDFAIERYLPTGQLDSAYGKVGRVQSPVSKDNDSINAVWLTEDAHLIVAGVVNEAEKRLGLCLARYNSEGLMDNRFGRDSFL